MSFTITQNLFIGDSTTITVVSCNDDAVEKQHFYPLLGAPAHVLGVAATYGEHCKLSSIAFSTLSQVLVINTSARGVPRPNLRPDQKQQRVARSRSLIQDHLLLNPEFHKYTFRMDQLAVALYLDLSIRISDAVDMLSVCTTSSRHSLQALMDAMGGEAILHKANVRSLFFNTSTLNAVSQVALKAWAACRAATSPHMSSLFAPLPRINTIAFPKEHILALSNIFRHADRLETMKPITVKNDVAEHFSTKKNAINVRCERFSTRIRPSQNQVLQIEIRGKETTSQVTGRARKVNGRSAHITVDGPVRGDKIVSVMTFGKEDPTFAETNRETIILKALQHKSKMLVNPYFRTFWLPKEKPIWPEPKERKGPVPVQFGGPLNPSQHLAVRRILSDKNDDRIVVIQGPPGTGKTTVIAASVISHRCARSSQNIWVAAQSNVAVKNIAEKFIKEGFLEFKLLVSKDFHFEWHQHLYEKLEPRLVRSDRFKMSPLEASRILLDCKVILCTLSMFSHPYVGVFLQIVPVEMMILDEASQIECGGYLPIFDSFHSTLSKLVLVGDDKQLPPYGEEQIPELRSVFEVSHLRRRAIFLNTQYRMPHVIGTFISQDVYGGKLLTEHNITTSKACLFVDVVKGREVKAGHSWVNREEAHIVVRLARLYVSQGRPFRIITPYDAQRNLIENDLKSDKLPWKDMVFNVDSFQGNEAEHVIVSVVRSQRPGFLKNQRRTNVMLTRCKQSMVICSSRSFLSGKASGTLVGELAASLGNGNWINVGTIDTMRNLW